MLRGGEFRARQRLEQLRGRVFFFEILEERKPECLLLDCLFSLSLNLPASIAREEGSQRQERGGRRERQERGGKSSRALDRRF